ncbi:MAG: hypothetical protein HRT61_09850 [Ekhidna sp.]|nr:hypothetical protein [Ekhidna sp.]
MKDLKLVMDILKDRKVPHAICGGAARDKAHGIEPRDVDICIWRGGVKDVEHNLILAIRDMRLAGLEVENLTDGDYFEEDRGQTGRVKLVLKVEGCIDLILWERDYLQSILQSFDSNINQYYLGEDGQAIYAGVDEGIFYLSPTVVAPCKRYKRLLEVIESCGWSVSEKTRVYMERVSSGQIASGQKFSTKGLFSLVP